MEGVVQQAADAAEAPARVREWYVLHVKPRTEKKVVLFLGGYRCFHHLPTYVKVTRVQRRKVRRELPIFPGYVFARLSSEERMGILRTNLVVRTIRVERPREMIHQLRQVAHASKAAPALRPVAAVFKAGDQVRVRYGPMRGTVGYVKREGAQATLCLNVEILGASVELSIDPADLELFNP